MGGGNFVAGGGFCSRPIFQINWFVLSPMGGIRWQNFAYGDIFLYILQNIRLRHMCNFWRRIQKFRQFVQKIAPQAKIDD